MTAADTICALSSAPGRAGVAVVRISGPIANSAVERIAGRLPRARTAAVRTLRTPDADEEIDRAIVLCFAGPCSFTGEDVVEIQCHGGRAVVAKVLDELVRAGCRLAEPGEFVRRAFEAGKLDLTAAEGLADLIDAETEAQRAQAVRQASGALARVYEGWRQELVTAMALMEASIDFSDEADVASDAVTQARAIVLDLGARIAAHLADGRRGEILREGYRVVLAGAPNAGKSSVLNALARRDAAIVSPEAGTTRDVIEVRLDLDGLPVLVSDTAGIRDGEGEIEREGIRRSLERGREAELVVWLVDAAAPEWRVPEAFRGDVLTVVNKADLLPAHDAHDGTRFPAPAGETDRRELTISALTGAGISELVAEIAKRARRRIGAGDAVVMTQARHRQAVEDCAAILQDFQRADVIDVELRAEDLRRAAHALARITGRIDAEMVLDQVFGRFCIGK